MKCAECRFFLPGAARWAVGVKDGRVDETQIGRAGECRRLPPPESFRWPKVKDVDWCGEFSERKSDDGKSDAQNAPFALVGEKSAGDGVGAPGSSGAKKKRARRKRPAKGESAGDQ